MEKKGKINEENENLENASPTGCSRPPWPTWPATRLLTPSWRLSTWSTPVTLDLSRVLGGVASLVVLGEPPQVLILDPGHPVLVLVVVALLNPLEIALALLLVLGQRIEGLLLLVLAHLVPAGTSGVGGALNLIGHFDSVVGGIYCESV